jgi:undecaprenyl-diphosphatase
MLSVFDSISLGFVQGMTEFLPISSSGHLIITRELLGISQDGGLAFDAVLQLATALAVVVYFRNDILDLVKNVFAKVKDPVKTKLTQFLIVGTIPAIIIGLLLEEYMDTVFRSPMLVALTLVIGALVMFAADRVLAKRMHEKTIGELTVSKSIGIGFFQALALVPGMSRSGMSISGGYFLGIPKDLAVRFSFLLSIPIIVGSGLVKVLDIVQKGMLATIGAQSLILGAVSAFVFGWLAIDFLLKFLRSNTFTVFVVYRMVLAVAILVWLV